MSSAFSFVVFCLPGCQHSSSSSSSAFPAVSLGFTILLPLLLLLPSQLYLWGSPVFFFCRPSWGSPFFFLLFFCLPSCISGVHQSSSFLLCLLPSLAITLGFTSLLPLRLLRLLPSIAITLGFTSLLPLRLLPSQLYLWGSPVFSFVSCLPSCISGVHQSSSSSSSSSSAFPAVSLGFTSLLPPLLLPSQLYLWGSPFFSFVFFYLPSCISGVHQSSSSSSLSSAFPAVSLGFTSLLLRLLLPSQLYLWGSSVFFLFFFFVFCLPQL